MVQSKSTQHCWNLVCKLEIGHKPSTEYTKMCGVSNISSHEFTDFTYEASRQREMECSVGWMDAGERRWQSTAAWESLAWDLLPAWAGPLRITLIWPCLLTWFACRINARFIHLTLCLPLPSPLLLTSTPTITVSSVKLNTERKREAQSTLYYMLKLYYILKLHYYNTELCSAIKQDGNL